MAILAGIAEGLGRFGTFQVQDWGPQTKALSQIKQVGTACKRYASDNDGRFPAKLEDLIPDYLPDAGLLACPYPDPKHPAAFLYYYGRTEKDDPKKTLLSSPNVKGAGSVFFFVDGSTKRALPE